MEISHRPAGFGNHESQQENAPTWPSDNDERLKPKTTEQVDNSVQSETPSAYEQFSARRAEVSAYTTNAYAEYRAAILGVEVSKEDAYAAFNEVRQVVDGINAEVLDQDSVIRLSSESQISDVFESYKLTTEVGLADSLASAKFYADAASENVEAAIVQEEQYKVDDSQQPKADPVEPEVSDPEETAIPEVSDPEETSGRNTYVDPDKWHLTLPTDEDGGTSGTAAEIKGSELIGFENDNYSNEDGKIVFSSAADGARTSENTKYSRSELRERIDGEHAAWGVDDGGALSATLSVDQMSKENDGDPARVVVGQIHGEDDELTRLYYDADGEVYFANEITGSDGEERLFGFENESGEKPNIALGEEWSYKIEVKNGKLDVAILAGGELYSAVPTDGVDPTEIGDDWNGDSFYFKAGVYNQVNDLDGHIAQGTGTTVATFYDLDVGHDGEGLSAWNNAS
jgi:hypothetical protein